MEGTVSDGDGAEDCRGGKFLVFPIQGRLCALTLDQIDEIAGLDAVHRLPLVPPYVLGVVSRYSVPYVLFDVGLLLFDAPSSGKKMLVLRGHPDRVAFLIDDVSDIVEVSGGELLPHEGEYGAEGISAVTASFGWEGREVLVLDIRANPGKPHGAPR